MPFKMIVFDNSYNCGNYGATVGGGGSWRCIIFYYLEMFFKEIVFSLLSIRKSKNIIRRSVASDELDYGLSFFTCTLVHRDHAPVIMRSDRADLKNLWDREVIIGGM